MRLTVEPEKQNTLLPRIVKAAVKLFVDKGIDGTTIRDIAARAGVSEGALYRHYRSKEELAWAIFTTHVNAFSLEMAAALGREKTAKAKIQAYVSLCFDAFEKDKDLFTYLIVSEHRELRNFPPTHRHPGHVAMGLVEEGQKRGELRKMDVQVASSLLVGGVMRLCVGRMYGTITEDLRKHQSDVAVSLWDALKSK